MEKNEIPVVERQKFIMEKGNKITRLFVACIAAVSIFLCMFFPEFSTLTTVCISAAGGFLIYCYILQVWAENWYRNKLLLDAYTAAAMPAFKTQKVALLSKSENVVAKYQGYDVYDWIELQDSVTGEITRWWWKDFCLPGKADFANLGDDMVYRDCMIYTKKTPETI